jgi:hypothetical protein
VGIRVRAPVAAIALLALSACTFPPLRTPAPSPSPTPTPSPTVAPTATPTPTPTPEPTPDAGALPDFGAGELIATTIDGLRVRQRPGMTGLVVTGLLPLSAALQVVMGPIVVEKVGWYLVADADPSEPQFEEGWIASGFEPEAYLGSTGGTSEATPFLASLAQTGNAEYGPIEIGDGQHAIRWIALDPERVRCQFTVLLAAGAGAHVPAIRATIGNGVDPGTLQPGSFAALGVRGQVFVTVESDCAWSLVIVRVPDPPAEPSISPTPEA